MDWTTLLVAFGGWIVTLVGYIMVDKREKQKQMDKFRDEIVSTLNNHREEYLKGIESVKDNITDLRADYKQSQAIISLQIDNLEKKQDKHNSTIERTYKLEKEVEILKALSHQETN